MGLPEPNLRSPACKGGIGAGVTGEYAGHACCYVSGEWPLGIDSCRSCPAGSCRGTAWYACFMALDQPTDVSIRQLVADSGSVTRGLRQGRTYTLTLNGEPLARMIPIRRRRAVPKEEVLAIFATAPVLDAHELRADLDEAVGQDVHDPYEATGL
jgi:antitoxin (DNA-binding transcriptional repressor) of toxin-antitoxin stability system